MIVFSLYPLSSSFGPGQPHAPPPSTNEWIHLAAEDREHRKSPPSATVMHTTYSSLNRAHGAEIITHISLELIFITMVLGELAKMKPDKNVFSHQTFSI